MGFEKTALYCRAAYSLRFGYKKDLHALDIIKYPVQVLDFEADEKFV